MKGFYSVYVAKSDEQLNRWLGGDKKEILDWFVIYDPAGKYGLPLIGKACIEHDLSEKDEVLWVLEEKDTIKIKKARKLDIITRVS